VIILADKTDKKFLNSKWIALDDSFYASKQEIGNAWAHDKPWDRLSELDTVDGMPVLRKKFGSEKKKIVKATVHATALGVFELFVNGQRVGVKRGAGVKYDELKPGYTDYAKRVLYYSYSLNSYLAEDGKNVLVAVLSNGWYQGRISFGRFGATKPGFNAVLELTYEDGSKDTIVTDESWEGKLAGPVLSADIWDGEYFDSRKTSYEELSTPGNLSRGWKNAQIKADANVLITKQVGPAIRVRNIRMKPRTAVVYSEVEENGTDFGKIIVAAKYRNKNALTLKKGEKLIFDMGQDMVGWANITVKGKANTRVTMRYAEMLNDSGSKSRGNDGPEGSVYTANYRSAKARGTYILSGGEAESYHPMFVFYGFRYVELTATDDVEIVEFKADVVGSDTKEVGKLETSSKDVNKLISNILWGQRGNYLSVPTDCPQRDERLGWTGDTQIFCPAAAFNADVDGFFHKWLQDARDSQGESGAYTDVIPRVPVVGEGHTAWADAGIIVPYNIYRVYADTKIIKECYKSMEAYMKFVATNGLDGPLPVYGDWLAYEPTEQRFIGICYYAIDVLLMEKMSTYLGKTRKAASYRKLYGRICRYFKKVYIKRGKLLQTSQTAYLLALKAGVLPENMIEPARKALAKKIIDNGYKLSTGFVGTGALNMTLSANGLDGLAYSLLLQTGNPSWLYSVYQGATTIWERWNSYTLDRGFGDVGMNSFNHYAYGAVLEWMYKIMLGIDADDDDPGFKHIILRPTPDTRTAEEMPEGQEHITWVRGSYKSAAGPIEAAWSMEPDSFHYEVSVPEGAYATLYLPVFDEQAATVTCNGVVSPAAQYEREGGRMVIRLASGRYAFEVMR